MPIPFRPLAAFMALALAFAAGLPVATGQPPAAAARPPSAGASTVAPPTDAFRWPLDGSARLVRRFDPPARPWLPGHRGVDLAATPGAVVRAAGPGVVAFAGLVAGRPVLSVLHADGIRTTYEPVEAIVRPGERVSAGTPIGQLRAGHVGCADACLHWGVRRDGIYLDPLSLLGLGRLRLLPLDAAALDADPNHLRRVSWPLPRQSA